VQAGNVKPGDVVGRDQTGTRTSLPVLPELDAEKFQKFSTPPRDGPMALDFVAGRETQSHEHQAVKQVHCEARKAPNRTQAAHQAAR
jgi:hypothetical protein